MLHTAQIKKPPGEEEKLPWSLHIGIFWKPHLLILRPRRLKVRVMGLLSYGEKRQILNTLLHIDSQEENYLPDSGRTADFGLICCIPKKNPKNSITGRSLALI